MIAPTLCFLGLVRGLERLRNDDLINEWARAHGHDRTVTNSDDVLVVLTTELKREADGSSTRMCPACGARNRTGMPYCDGCQHRSGSS